MTVVSIWKTVNALTQSGRNEKNWYPECNRSADDKEARQMGISDEWLKPIFAVCGCDFCGTDVGGGEKFWTAMSAEQTEEPIATKWVSR